MVVRRPADPTRCSGTVVLEWLNVSSGADAAPSYGFLGPEIVRRGHVWVGLSAQKAGIETAPALVDVGGIELRGVRQVDPARYAQLHHPGDAWSYDIFTAVARSLRDGAPGGPTEDVAVTRLIAVGESQSAYTLTTYLNGVQPSERVLDAALVHSRGGPAAPLDGPAGRIDLEAGRDDPPVRIRDDLDVPVLVLETETDVLGHLAYLPARQDDSELFRLWEVAGTAHADRSLVGDFESVLGCATPVNRGQQRFVVRAALRALEEWDRRTPPRAERLRVVRGRRRWPCVRPRRSGQRVREVCAPRASTSPSRCCRASPHLERTVRACSSGRPSLSRPRSCAAATRPSATPRSPTSPRPTRRSPPASSSPRTATRCWPTPVADSSPGDCLPEDEMLAAAVAIEEQM